MASSSFKCFVSSADPSSLNLQNENSEKGLPLLRNPQSLPMPSSTGSLHVSIAAHHDQLSPSRLSKGMVICGFAIAASTAIGLSFCSFDSLAIAAELEVNNTAVVSVASAHDSPNLKPASGQDPNLTLTSNPSPGNPNPSFSMAIPIPHDEVWGHVQNDFIAPLPHMAHEHGMVLPYSQPRKTNIALEGSTSKCPPWTPSELEMVLPDFHGRPKPFPHQGHHWSAAYVMKGTDGEAFLQLFDSNIEVELDESDDKATITIEDKQQKNEKLSLLKVLGTGKLRCFSM